MKFTECNDDFSNTVGNFGKDVTGVDSTSEVDECVDVFEILTFNLSKSFRKLVHST